MCEKILVIDDDLPSGQALMWALEAKGHEVYLFQDGTHALNKIKKFVPDVVLCDICMPEMMGYEVCKKMKADRRLKDTLFIAQTGIDSDVGIQRAFDSGFDYHMVKPVDINALLELINEERSKLSAIEAV